MSLFANWAFAWDDVKHVLPEGRGLCLDLGCGDGQHKSWVEKKGWTWIGLDIDVSRGGAMICGDAENLPLDDGSVTLVLLFQVLEHVPHPWIALKEVFRVLKPGGWVYGSVSCLEPVHDVSYYGFTHYGIEQALTDQGFTGIHLHHGINAFSLITRQWFKRLLKPQLEYRLVLYLIKCVLRISTGVILWLRKVSSILRRGHVSEGYNRTLEWIREEGALGFAGHIQFLARKRKSF